MSRGSKDNFINRLASAQAEPAEESNETLELIFVNGKLTEAR